MWTGCKKCIWLFDLLIFILIFLFCTMRLVQVIIRKIDAKFPQWNPKVMIDCSFDFKVHIFWAATKFCEIPTSLLTGTTKDKNKVEILQNFVAFSEYMNFFKFKKKPWWVASTFSTKQFLGLSRVLALAYRIKPISFP